MTYRERALQLIYAGVCDPADAEKTVGDLNPQQYQSGFNYNVSSN